MKSVKKTVVALGDAKGCVSGFVPGLWWFHLNSDFGPSGVVLVFLWKAISIGNVNFCCSQKLKRIATRRCRAILVRSRGAWAALILVQSEFVAGAWSWRTRRR